MLGRLPYNRDGRRDDSASSEEDSSTWHGVRKVAAMRLHPRFRHIALFAITGSAVQCHGVSAEHTWVSIARPDGQHQFLMDHCYLKVHGPSGLVRRLLLTDTNAPRTRLSASATQTAGPQAGSRLVQDTVNSSRTQPKHTNVFKLGCPDQILCNVMAHRVRQ